MRKLLPIILAVVGLGAGLGAGKLMQPAPQDTAHTDVCEDFDPATKLDLTPKVVDLDKVDFVKLNNQFVVPVVSDGKVKSLVVLSLSLEVSSGNQDIVYQREPKLRDVLLQVLFDHANAGGFDGVFTSGRKMDLLHQALLETAQKTLGGAVSDVLIQDLVRQDV